MLPSTDAVALSAKPPVIMLEGRLPILEAPAAKALGLHDGQVVRPTVEAREGQLVLTLQGRQLPGNLPTDARLAVGEQLAMRVQMDAQGGARLLPAPYGAPTALAPTWPQRLEQLGLRPSGMGALMHLLRPGVLPALLAGSPQPEVGRLVDQLLRLRPSMSQLTAGGLRHWIRYSGWFLESQLSKGRDVSSDAKALVRQMQASWSQAPDQVLRLLSDALDDIEAGQLQAGQDLLNVGRDGWISLVLPFADADPVHLRFKSARQGAGGEADNGPLVIDLHTRSHELGDVWLQTRITQHTQVQMTMWAVQEHVVHSARASTGTLRDAMDEAGLVLLGLQVVHGVRHPDDGSVLPQATGRLVDVRA